VKVASFENAVDTFSYLPFSQLPQRFPPAVTATGIFVVDLYNDWFQFHPVFPDADEQACILNSLSNNSEGVGYAVKKTFGLARIPSRFY
jgi:hypothetical protein